MVLVIFNIDPLPHQLQVFREDLDDLELDAQVERKIGVLMGGVHGAADKEIDVGRIFK